MSFAQIIHTIIVWTLTLALAALCVWQWLATEKLMVDNNSLETQLEEISLDLAELRKRNEELTESQLAAQAEKATQAKQIQEPETKLQAQESGQVQELESFMAKTKEQLEAAKTQLQQAQEAIAKRDKKLTELQEKQTQLTQQLNERTKQYNDLVKKVQSR